MNCVNFDLRECNFNDADNNKKDKKGDSRATSGRATIFRETGSGEVPYCFTLEGNYATGLRINTLQPRFNVLEGKRILKEDLPVQDTSSAFYKKRKIPVYGSEVYKDVGQSFLVSVLDLAGINPLSRLIKTEGEEQSEALSKLRKDLKREYFKPTIKSLKKKGAKGKKGKNMEGPSFELVLGGNQKRDAEDDDYGQAASFSTNQ